MFAGNRIHDWWTEIAALTERRTRLLLSQIGRRGEDGKFPDMLVGGSLLGFLLFSVKQSEVCCGRWGQSWKSKRFKDRTEVFSWILGRMRKEAGKENHRRTAGRIEDQGQLETMDLEP